MLNAITSRGSESAIGLASVGVAIAALGGILWGREDHTWAVVLFVFGGALIAAAALGLIALSIAGGADSGGPETSKSRSRKGISNAQAAKGDIYNVNSFNQVIASAKTPSEPVAVLQFSHPQVDKSVGIHDKDLNPVNSVILWRVDLANVAEKTKAANVSVKLFSADPNLPVLPVQLHKYHDDRKPYSLSHDVRFGDPIKFDVIAKDFNSDEFFLWRSDMPDEWSFIYHLSPAERDALLSALRGSGVKIVLRATPDPPAGYTEGHFVIRITPSGDFLMEPEPIVVRPEPAVLKFTAIAPTVTVRSATLWQRLKRRL